MAGPSSSRRPPTDVVAKSEAMQRFVKTVLDSRRTVIPISVGSNMSELDTLIDQFMRQRGLNGSVVTIDPRNPKLFPMDQSGIKVITFLDARRIPEGFQEEVTKHLMDQKVIFALLPRKMAGYPLEKWSPSFAAMCSPPVFWPAWRDRKEDHRELITRAYAQLATNGTILPDLNRSAMNHLLTDPSLTGVDDVVAALTRGLRIYRKSHIRGSLRDVHLNYGRDTFPHAPLAEGIAEAQPAGE